MDSTSHLLVHTYTIGRRIVRIVDGLAFEAVVIPPSAHKTLRFIAFAGSGAGFWCWFWVEFGVGARIVRVLFVGVGGRR